MEFQPEFWSVAPLLSAAAFCVSLVCSTVGVSGAFLLLPVQILLLNSTAPSISSTNQLFNILATPAGIVRFVREGRMVWPLTIVLLAGSLPGLGIGLLLRTSLLEGTTAFTIFAALVLAGTGCTMLHKAAGQKKTTKSSGRVQGARVHLLHCDRRTLRFSFQEQTYSCSVPGLAALSLGVGIVGGAYGIGGGAIMAPFLVAIFGLPVHALAAATLFSTFMTAVASTAGSLMLHAASPALDIMPDFAVGLALGIGGMAGMYCGARLQKHLPSVLLNRLLTGCVFVAALVLLARLV